MSRIKNIHIITGLQAGGAEMMLYKTVSNIDKSKYDPIVISLLSAGPVSKLIKQDNIEIYHLNMSKNPINLIKTFIQLVVLIKKIKPVIIHSYMFHADIMARFAGKLASVPIIISSIRNEYIGGYLREKIFKYTDWMIDATTAVCRQAGEVQIGKGSIKREKLNVIYNGIMLSEFQVNEKEEMELKKSLGIPLENKVIINVGRIDPQKNHQLLIESFKEALMNNNKLTLLIVGDGSLKDDLNKKILDAHLENNIILTGVRKDVPKLMAISDLFVLTSSWEGMPNVLLEAMSMKLPIISTRVGGVSEIVDESHGVLIDVSEQTQHELTKSINEILNLDYIERRKLGEKGYEKVKKHFTIEKTVEKTEELYELLLKKCYEEQKDDY